MSLFQVLLNSTHLKRNSFKSLCDDHHNQQLTTPSSLTRNLNSPTESVIRGGQMSPPCSVSRKVTSVNSCSDQAKSTLLSPPKINFKVTTSILTLLILNGFSILMPCINCIDLNTNFLLNNGPANQSYVYYEDQSGKFSHMAINAWTGQIYLGGMNRIYQLTSNLALESSVEMGPRPDSPECPVTRSCPQVKLKPTNYYNKALVIDYPKSQLISCGSLFQGVCSVHKLDNVSIHDTPSNESVVANNATASTVAFIAPGPPMLPRMHVLYVGTSYTGNGPYGSDLPTVSSRSLDSSNMFLVASAGVTTGTRLLVNSLARDRYPIHYVYGFDYNGFSYFLTFQKKSSESPKPFISKLVRICQKDRDYYSYTEVPLVCKSSANSVDYNLAQAAYVGLPGSELALSLGITAQDKVLFVVFAKSSDNGDVYNQPDNNSALCVYSLPAIHRKFTQNIQHCFNGNGNQGLDFVNPTKDCELTVSTMMAMSYSLSSSSFII